MVLLRRLAEHDAPLARLDGRVLRGHEQEALGLAAGHVGVELGLRKRERRVALLVGRVVLLQQLARRVHVEHA